MNIVSLFSGCGGLDLGFEKAGFNVIWANDSASSVWETYERNFPNSFLNKKSLRYISEKDIPDDIVGIIGGPPCQSWSNAGNGKGMEDKRGQLFFEFVRILKAKKPYFFLAENVEGMLSERNRAAFDNIKLLLENAGYTLSVNLLNTADFGVPQNRKRVIFVGYRMDLNYKFSIPEKSFKKVTIKDVLFDIKDLAIPSIKANRTNGFDKCKIPNHEYWEGDFSYIFMSRNRVLTWDEPSYTIQASGRQVSIHPMAPKMLKVEKDVMRFDHEKNHLYRRLSIRECARIQTFPDNFLFFYESLNSGYKMVGNAVPVEFARLLAEAVYGDLCKLLGKTMQRKESQATDLKSTRLIAV